MKNPGAFPAGSRAGGVMEQDRGSRNRRIRGLRGVLLLVAALGAGCARSSGDVADPQAEGLIARAPYIRTVTENAVAEGVQRRFTLCYNPRWTEDLRPALDRLVFAQCGRYVEPLAERPAACTLLHPHALDFSCLLRP